MWILAWICCDLCFWILCLAACISPCVCIGCFGLNNASFILFGIWTDLHMSCAEIYTFVVSSPSCLCYGHKNKMNLLESCVRSISFSVPKKRSPTSSFLFRFGSCGILFDAVYEVMLNLFCCFCGFLLAKIHQQLEAWSSNC